MKRHIGFLFLTISLCNQVSAEESTFLTSISSEMLKHFFSLWKESGYGYDPNHIETAAWIVLNSENNHEFLKWPHSGEKNKESWKGQIPKNLVAQVHTHSSVTDPKPSRLDRDCAARIKAPVYTISKAGIWKVNPDGKLSKEAGRDWWIELDN